MDKPIRVLHVLQRMEAGGTQTLLMNIYRKIDRTKIQFDFLVEYKDKQFYDDEIIAMGGRIFRTNFRKDLNILKFKVYLSHLFRNHPEYKIVHVHTYSIGYFVLKEAEKAGVKVRIAHSHNNETVRDYKYIPKLLMQKIYIKHATDLFACSHEAGIYLFKDKPFKILKNVIDSSKFKFDSSKRNKMRVNLGIENRFVVGNVGRLHPQKNQLFLIDIFYKIKVKKVNAILLIIGTGPMKEKLEEKVQKMGLTDSVLFLGNRKDMDYIYQAMDVFVFPSLFEGFGISAVEAQASATPSLCSDGLPPEVDVTPLYKTQKLSDNETMWADAAIKLSQNRNRHTNTQHYIIDSGYDVTETANLMQEYYLSKYKDNVI